MAPLGVGGAKASSLSPGVVRAKSLVVPDVLHGQSLQNIWVKAPVIPDAVGEDSVCVWWDYSRVSEV